MGRIPCVFFVLLSILLFPGMAVAQAQGGLGSEGDPDKGFEIEQNYPNPFNPDTRIPFVLKDEMFVEGRPATVTMRIYNVLLQYVASPTAVNHQEGEGTRVIDLEYPFPGRYEVHWDGRDRSGSPVASGVYILEVTVNGRSQTLKMFVSR